MCKNQHKWHKEIKAWADGAEIEVLDVTNFKHPENAKWVPFESFDYPVWIDEWKYRIKPQLKPDLIRYGIFNFEVTSSFHVISNTVTPYVHELFSLINEKCNFKVTFADDGTGKYVLKSMEII